LWKGQPVAIKQLKVKKSTLQLKQDVAFLREASIISQLSHQNLVKFHGFVFSRQQYLLITEFCYGGTVFSLLYVKNDDNGFELEVAQKLKMCCDVASAMEYLHNLSPQIIHRDLKSLNLLLVEMLTKASDTPHVKVSDFGLGKMNEQDVEWGVMTKEVGTANWMAPEVASSSYNEKVDIYSFAMVMFEIIAEEVPFEDMDQKLVFKAVLDGDRPELDAIHPSMPKQVVDLMVESWVQKPDERPDFTLIRETLETASRAGKASNDCWRDVYAG